MLLVMNGDEPMCCNGDSAAGTAGCSPLYE